MNAMEERHLTIETMIDGKQVGVQEINDPFLHNRTYYEPSIWDRLKILLTGRVLFEVKVRGDDEALRQWFRTDKVPGPAIGDPPSEAQAKEIQHVFDEAREQVEKEPRRGGLIIPERFMR